MVSRPLYWSFNIVSNTERVSEAEAPTTWEEVWAFAAQNPGRVALFGPRPNYVIEVALMADGVPMEEGLSARRGEARTRVRLARTACATASFWYETGDSGAAAPVVGRRPWWRCSTMAILFS